MKRKQREVSSDEDPLQSELSTTPKRPKQTSRKDNELNGTPTKHSAPDTPSGRLRSRLTKQTPTKNVDIAPDLVSPLKTPTARALFKTPTKLKSFDNGTPNGTPSRIRNADRSAKRKSARVLLDPNEDDLWIGSNKLATRNLGCPKEPDSKPEDATKEVPKEPPVTPRKRGRPPKVRGPEDQTPKTPKTPRTPRRNERVTTPEGDLPPQEKYFFQTRTGPVQTSNNTMAKSSLFTHEEFFEQLGMYKDPLQEEKDYLLELHERSFPQWHFEMTEGFNVCIYGYGSKRKLVQRYADWLYEHYNQPPAIVVVNGYTPDITIRSILATVATAILGPDDTSKLGIQPNDVLESIRAALLKHPPPQPITVLINSIDAPPLRRAQQQSHLARLADIPHINILATADTPNFLVLWDITLRDKFNFVFHDCTTFASYDVELNVVDEVHSLLGRKVRRVGGKQGIGFVLKSLPENTRKLYRLLITEILMMLGDSQDGEEEHEARIEADDPEESDTRSEKVAAIEWRALFHKASEEFISSSEMMFRTQLKEFYDHQMITSKLDPSGAELLGVPLSREEIESILEDLVIDG
ncbi:origin recognition complex subunit 2 [Trichophyton tonsurans CBS 112818]|uniref:Origin recognition complex subunit 2 n=1 Tax=Trichophyton tonsurans (strain CBS 112818) TaxID=647933 RepID=F2RP64_TRIT1|nr:origin recognition complex subunit 2 [Trichophyton tonsurans CBS 112818]